RNVTGVQTCALPISYLIIPSSQKGCFNKMLVWLIPVLEISVLIVVIYGIFKSVISYRRNKQDEEHDFLDVIRISLEPKLGNGFRSEERRVGKECRYE